ncbi:radical SAM protein [Engelhardtia mirabilis]|uniref:Radical SAM core domain-containing protein n=1 Tax=Engelhardtia mirabilis TaxID=2528011 RepID=A0A518BFH6_9BACT|nr:hypothetical protein Pla133_08000 [Planctomycetes bacterium Pla133]QDV00060.1 hypothetical protein Pla86_07990 [Planctomycetes bacterium Pla86]
MGIGRHTTELRRLLAEKWRQLPEAARTPQQLAGRGGVGCGATHGVQERCDLACTSCYLTDIANRTPPLPFAEVDAQLAALRAHLGPGGKVQLTAGEVTLLPLAELGRIVERAIELELDPMLMTNGRRLLREPDYFEALVRDHGLRKVSFHVDLTQRGRPEVARAAGERDLDPLRLECAELIRSVRRRTGAALHGAMTVTVTPRNLDQVPDVVEFARRNADAFRIVSFQPAAEVGRTEDARALDHGAPSMDELWERVCAPYGRLLERHALHFGHPECNVTVPVVSVTAGDEAFGFEVVRAGSVRDARGFAAMLQALADHADSPRPDRFRAGWLALRLLARPSLGLATLGMMARRAVQERRALGRILSSLVRGRRVRVQPQLFVIHRFMDADELATPLGRERLEACVFRVAVDGELVSMCELNASGLREELNRRAGARPARSAS